MIDILSQLANKAVQQRHDGVVQKAGDELDQLEGARPQSFAVSHGDNQQQKEAMIEAWKLEAAKAVSDIVTKIIPF